MNCTALKIGHFELLQVSKCNIFMTNNTILPECNISLAKGNVYIASKEGLIYGVFILF